MTSKNPFDEMDLPKSNTNEELEILSRRAFENLFPVDLFELRSENKDKGIDYDVELKRNGQYTNIRFLVQLKAHHQVIPNRDGSLSHPIRTSNIQYLLNGGVQAYYVLFVKETQSLYYVELGEFLHTLMEKGTAWQTQAHHSLRFSQKLDASAVKRMYQETEEKGVFLRSIRERLLQASQIIKESPRISFDKDLKITDDVEIKRWIEKHGLDLVNDGKWNQLLILHKKATGNLIPSPLYDLAVGLGFFYDGDFLLALKHLKDAYRKKKELLNGLQDHLIYFLELTKLHLGLSSPEAFTKAVQDFEEDSHIGLYLKVEKARDAFMYSKEEDFQKRFEEMKADIELIEEHPDCTPNIALLAQAELLYCEGQANNVLYFQSVAKLNHIEQFSGPNLELRVELVKQLIEKQEQWEKSIRLIIEKIRETKNDFIFYLSQFYYVKVIYERDLYTRHIQVVQNIPGVNRPPLEPKEESLEPLISIISEVIQFYNQSHFVENLIASMATLYELFHYKEDYEQANQVMSQLESLVEEKGSLENQEKIKNLKNGGTAHENLAVFVGEDIMNAPQNQQEYDELVKQMKTMDQQEKGKKTQKNEEWSHIELFPIGYFSFPSSQLPKVLETLRVQNEKAQENISNMLRQKIVPVVNILQEEIHSEGYAGGKYEDKGMRSWRNVHRIRKAFFDNGYVRVYYH